MPWYDAWGWGTWFLFPFLMCMAMMAMMFMGRGHRREHAHADWHAAETPSDPALTTLRQRFASGELTQQEYEEQRHLLPRV